MKTFSTYGPVNPEDNYVVSRPEELADFIKRAKLGRYIVIFAPRQTGKTTFFQWALDALAADTAETYFPIELNFEVYEDYPAVGQDLLCAYLDQFVSLIRGVMHLEVQTRRGRMDIVIFYNMLSISISHKSEKSRELHRKVL